jgi:hypothetical protein
MKNTVETESRKCPHAIEAYGSDKYGNILSVVPGYVSN